MTCITTYCRIRARSRCQGQKMMGCHNGATRKNTCLIILVYPQRIKRRLCRGCSLQEQQGWEGSAVAVATATAVAAPP